MDFDLIDPKKYRQLFLDEQGLESTLLLSHIVSKSLTSTEYP
jgi:hypothetical protein